MVKNILKITRRLPHFLKSSVFYSLFYVLRVVFLKEFSRTISLQFLNLFSIVKVYFETKFPKLCFLSSHLCAFRHMKLKIVTFNEFDNQITLQLIETTE